MGSPTSLQVIAYTNGMEYQKEFISGGNESQAKKKTKMPMRLRGEVAWLISFAPTRSVALNYCLPGCLLKMEMVIITMLDGYLLHKDKILGESIGQSSA
ncbi:hypothetical protein NPIL_78181 [Nephila pilipes]|nr:hypothetical protein NPIL_78181 [Nephila pilipes]